MEKRPLIIDCDPGIDDAQAIMMLAASGAFDIMGITTLDGSCSLQQTSVNALFLSELYGIRTETAIGASRPMVRSGMPYAEETNGSNGLAGYSYERPEMSLYGGLAWELVYRRALEADGNLEIIALGPLTNIATAVLKYPALTEMIKQIVIASGSSRAGNITPYAEFNSFRDPHAMSVVLDAGFKRLVMVDLEASRKAFMYADEAVRMGEYYGRVGKLFRRMINYNRDKARENGERDDTPYYSHASVAAAIAVNPELARLKPYYALCETQSTLTMGQTVIDWHDRFNHRPNVALVDSIDRDGYIKLFFDCLSSYSEKDGGNANE